MRSSRAKFRKKTPKSVWAKCGLTCSLNLRTNQKGGNNKDKAGKEKVDRQMEGKKNRYMKAAAGIEAEVKAGKISKEDAEKRLGEMRKAMFPETNAKADDQADPKADEKADGQRRRRLFRRNGG